MLVAAFALMPEGRLACDMPMLRDVSPDGAHVLTVCYRPPWFAMPGGGGDGNAWAVLRDRGSAILGVVDVDGPIGFPMPPLWTAASVSLPLSAGFDLPPPASAPLRWWRDRLWRVRALLGLTQSGVDFR